MDAAHDKTLLLIDGHSLAFRAFYALPPESFQTASGTYTNAVHGFLQMLLSLLEHEHPTHMAVAFDLGRVSFRTEQYPEYKGTRGETPPEFLGQTEELEAALKAMNITTLTKTNYEGDDIIATLATMGEDHGFRVLVVSGDRDAIQLVDDEVTLLYPLKGVQVLTRFTPEAVEQKYGVRPEQYPDLAALVGETSDNLIGVPSVGPKTAAKWLAQFGSLDGIIAHQEQIGGKVGEKLREHIDNAVRNRRLNALVRDLDLGVTLDDLVLTEIDRDAVDRVFGSLELRTVGARVRQLGPGLRKVAPAPGRSAPVQEMPRAIPAVDLAHPTDPRPDGVVAEDPPGDEPQTAPEVPSWAGDAAVLGASLETDGPMVHVGLASSSHAASWTVEASRLAESPLAQWLFSTQTTLVFHDLKAAFHAAWRVGVDITSAAADSMLTWFVADSTRPSYTLESAADLFFAAELAVSDPNQLVPETEPAAPGVRAWFALRLQELLEPQLTEEARSTILHSIELPVSRILATMEHTGAAVDPVALQRLSDEFGQKAAQIAQRAYAVIGHEVNLASPKQLQEVLFGELGLPKTRKLKTGYSTNAEALADLVVKTGNEFPLLLLQHRDQTKLRQMVETLSKAVGPDSRIHTTYVQTGAATGRLSSADPNLQNIPVRTDDGKRIRAAFVAGPGYHDLLTADYSQIEMRIMAHMSRDAGLIEAFRSGEDLHRFVGSRVFGVEPSEVTSAMRSKVKAMSYGLVYGLSAFGLSRQLRIPQREAQDLMASYFRRFGGVRDYLREVVEQARQDGFTTTLFGRRRLFPDLRSSNRVLRDNAERAALNAPIQGTAADIMKMAMIRVSDALRSRGCASRMLLQVHDELIFEVAAGEHEQLEELVVDAMSHAATLDVPLDVHVGFGPDWNTAAH